MAAIFLQPPLVPIWLFICLYISRSRRTNIYFMQAVNECNTDESKSVQCEVEADIVLKLVRSVTEVIFKKKKRRFSHFHFFTQQF